MIEGINYCYIYPENDKTSVHIKFLDGPFASTVFKYGKVKIKEENDQAYLQFGFDVLQSDVLNIKKLEEDETFKNYIGDFLVEIMVSNMHKDIVNEVNE